MPGTRTMKRKATSRKGIRAKARRARASSGTIWLLQWVPVQPRDEAHGALGEARGIGAGVQEAQKGEKRGGFRDSVGDRLC